MKWSPEGVGNLLSGVLGAMPITAVIVRSSVNVSNGAQSKLSIFIHGVLLLICGLWFSGLLTLIPLASLAAVLLYTGYKLATPRLFIEQFRRGGGAVRPVPRHHRRDYRLRHAGGDRDWSCHPDGIQSLAQPSPLAAAGALR